MMKKTQLLAFIASSTVLLMLFTNCSQKNKNAQLPPQRITVVEVQNQDIPIYFEFVGMVHGFKDIPIRARVDGYLEGIHFDEGLPVKKGQLLYTIDSQPYEAEVASKRSQLAEAKTAFVKAQSDLNRYEPLAKTNAVSQSDYDASVAQFEAAQAAVEAAEAVLRLSQIQLSYTRIKSPINGLIGKTLAKEGEYVGKSPNPVILNTVSRIDNIHVEFFIPENQYLVVARYGLNKNEGEKIVDENEEDYLELVLADGSIHPHKGKINFLDRGVDSKTGAILIQAAFPNPNSIVRPGQYAKVKIEIDNNGGYLAVPQRCVSELQGQHSVFVVNDSNKVESRQIIVGDRLADYWAVKEGLQVGEKIVIDALQKVRNGVIIEPELIEFKSQQPAL
ncbi:efflux RND transporter periplasmic adaptor subunit [Carboxylicivirga sp. N1Y90]|uniref:efflux RND transporter periplasmic adaptor subunit n=1 Tax=Carboxylicivirga fragile TaxID=3417571 RepID=UPI003D359098|nr:efflux RND transporter periplasmic adaptor subunit [Marinilabiliaceae bacterium N1Y90]